LVEEEPATTAWFAIRLGDRCSASSTPSPDEGGRDAHLSGRVAALTANASELLAEPPTIEQIDVLAAKLPH
jgi:hypothetical protein